MNQADSFITSVTAFKTVCTCKLLWLLLGRRMVRMIMELVGNRSFTFITSNGKRYDTWRMASHRDPSWHPFSPSSTSDLPTTVSRKYANADDLAFMHADRDWQTVEGVQSKDMATIGEYHQTWKLRLSTTKLVLVVFHLNKKEGTTWAESQPQQQNPVLLVRAQIPRRNVGQDTHVPTTPRVTSQEVHFMRWTFEAARWMGVWCWGNNAATSHLRPGPFNSKSIALLAGSAVLTRASLILQPTTPCELWLDACVLHQRTIFLPRRHQTCWASSQCSHTVSSTPCYGAWTSAPLSTHLSIECRCTAFQMETPIFLPAAQQLITSSDDDNRSAVECRKVGVHYETLYVHSRPTLLEW